LSVEHEEIVHTIRICIEERCARRAKKYALGLAKTSMSVAVSKSDPAIHSWQAINNDHVASVITIDVTNDDVG
jgi:hypothetical protein